MKLMFIKCRFVQGTCTYKDYNYKTYLSSVRTGDFVIVETVESSEKTFAVCKVSETECVRPSNWRSVKFAFQKVDNDNLLSSKDFFQNELDKYQRAIDLKSKLDELLKEEDEYGKYKRILEKNPELARQFEELNDMFKL
jgi:hypothetical protein